METVLIILGALLIILGVVGSVLPVLPGPPISYAAILVLQATQTVDFSQRFLIVWLIITLFVTVLDYFLPVVATKKLGGSRSGVWGASIGLVAGLFLGPPGIILGPFAGAVLGELVEKKELRIALKSGFGSFLGFMTGTVLKLVVSLILSFYFIKALV